MSFIQTFNKDQKVEFTVTATYERESGFFKPKAFDLTGVEYGKEAKIKKTLEFLPYPEDFNIIVLLCTSFKTLRQIDVIGEMETLLFKPFGYHQKVSGTRDNPGYSSILDPNPLKVTVTFTFESEEMAETNKTFLGLAGSSVHHECK